MLTISRSQISSFGNELKIKFILETIPKVRNKYPEKTFKIKDQELLILIDNIVDRAAKFQIVLENDVFQFIFIDYRLGNSFELDPEKIDILKILQHRTLTGTRKMEKVIDLISSLD